MPSGLDTGRVRLIVWAVVLWCMSVTMARAIRFPNEYCSAHWLLDYRFGFMKRGLIGSINSAITSILGTPITYPLISVLAGIGFAAFTVAVACVCYRVLRAAPQDNGAILLALAFASSPFFVMYSHTFGAFDAILFGLTIAAAGLTLSNRPLLAAAVQVVAVLIHEMYMLTGFPLVCLAACLQCMAARGNDRWVPHALAQAGPVLVFGFIVLYHSLALDAQALRAQLEAHLASFPFLSEPGLAVAEYHTIGFFEYFRYQRLEFFERLFDPTLLGVVGPSLVLLLWGAHARYRIVPFSPLSLAVLGAVLAPLTMHAIAWDTERISIFTLGSAFLALWLLSETRERDEAHDSLLPLLAVPVILLNIVTLVPLMEGQTERAAGAVRWLLYAPVLLTAMAAVVIGPAWQTAWREAVAGIRARFDR